ncbi:MAG: radical SAM protein [Methanomassiliicoccales archaeon]|nr:MAG: radical SAM protein [Methanomassiliicoccales archaeon]
MNIILLDGYVDEPSCLGVPPYISFYIRYCAGAIWEAGHDLIYLTIDEYRQESPKIRAFKKANMLMVIGGAIVPGKYLGGTPASIPEIRHLAEDFKGTRILGGPIARFEYSGAKRAKKLRDVFDFMPKMDLDAFVYDLLVHNSTRDRLRNEKEWRTWAIKGSNVITQHPDFPKPLIIELESYRGCVRYFTGGCSFCIEPLFGEPVFRHPEDIIEEIAALSRMGAMNYRLGGQSCIFSYKAKELGKTETPKPDPLKIENLLKGIRRAAPNIEVLHTDNANPAVIAEHPDEVKRILKSLVKYCTSGNVLALGMESADPKVIKANNLNATPDQVMKAVSLINEFGAERGENGMPKLLPGINILCGLSGETKSTYEHNFRFLMDILEAGQLLRRVNIRQVSPVRTNFDVKMSHTEFLRFKKRVRERFDNKMLKLMVPIDTILRRIYIEKIQGNLSYGRQVGTYPLLVGIPYQIKEGRIIDVIITDHGQRSVTGIEHPMNVNLASLKALSSLPNIGKKRAARIIRSRPFRSKQEFLSALDDETVARNLLGYITF